MRQRVVLTGLLLLALLFGGAPAGAQTKDEDLIKVRSDASVPGSGAVVQLTAIANAKRRILAETMEAAFSLSDVTAANKLLDTPEKYIKSTQVVSAVSENGQTRVEVESFVRRNQLLADAALLLLPQLPFAPKILLLTGQQTGTDALQMGQDTAFAALVRGFVKDRELELADIEPVRQCHDETQLAAAIQGDNEMAATIARERFADVLVVGLAQLSGESGGIGGSVLTCKAVITLRVFRCSDGKLMDAFSQETLVHSVPGGGGEAQVLQDACDKRKNDLLVAAVIAATSLRTTDDLIITVESPGAKSRLDALAKAIGALPGVADVETLLYTDGLARLRVSYDGHPGALIKAITGRPYEGQTLESRRALLRDVALRFVPAASPR